jgi:TrmH family RNA methyltransferase
VIPDFSPFVPFNFLKVGPTQVTTSSRASGTLLAQSSGMLRLNLFSLIHQFYLNPFGQKLARRLRKRGVVGVRLSYQLYRDLTLASEPQGIGAVVRQQWIPLANVGVGRDSFWLAVESIESPGNLGTIIRTAEAAGISGIFVLDSESDPFDPAAVRASMGSLFSQKLTRCTPCEFADWAKSRGVALVGSSPTGLLDYKALRCRWPAVLLIGSEKRGLSGHLAETVDFMVRIRMRGGCDSINVSVAAGILLFELCSQRRGS